MPFHCARPQRYRLRIARHSQKQATDVPFSGEFVEDIVAEQYDREQARGQIFAAFALLAVVIAVATTDGHAMKVTRISPVRALRYE